MNLLLVEAICLRHAKRLIDKIDDSLLARLNTAQMRPEYLYSALSIS